MSLAALRRPLFATRRSRTVAFGAAVAGVGVGAAVLGTSQPTGYDTADAFWSLALAVPVAVFGATARRWTWFLPAGAAAVLGGDAVAMVCAAIAIAIALVSVVRETRSRARGAIVAGLGVIALLRVGPIGFHGLSALVTAAAVTPVLVSGYVRAGKRVRHRTTRVLQVAGVGLGLMVAGAVVGVAFAQGSLRQGMASVNGGLDAARAADDDTAAQEFALAARSLGTADSTLSSWFVAPAKNLPLIGPNLTAVGSVSAQASEVARVTSLAASEADVDALRFVGGRLDPTAASNMVAPLFKVKLSLDQLREQVDDVRSPWLLGPVAEPLERLADQVEEARPEAQTALEAVAVAPILLGGEGPQRYLVLFTTPVEARGRTGFPGNFAELLVTDGKLSMPRFGRISELESGGLPPEQRTLTQPVDYVARYGRFDVTRTWRNLTMSADFVAIARAAAELYPQSGGQEIDGVLSVDPQGLAALMRYTGPIEVPQLGEPLTADNTADFLMRRQYELFPDNEARTDLLEDVARTTFDRLVGADLPGPRRISEDLGPIVDGGHIQFSPIRDDVLGAMLDFGISGFLPWNLPGDMMTVTTSNAAGSKIDLFTYRRQEYDVRWDPETGQVGATLRVTLENRAPTSGLPNYVIGNVIGLPPGTNRSYVSVYSTLDLAGASVGGQPAPLQSEVETGFNVYSAFVDIPPGGSVQLELELEGVVEGRAYRLNMPVQPFATADEVAVSVQATDGSAVASRQATVEGDTARLATTRDEPRLLTVSAP
jgi:hypothetical protein